jgi:hypothetical protein
MDKALHTESVENGARVLLQVVHRMPIAHRDATEGRKLGAGRILNEAMGVAFVFYEVYG